MIAAGLTRDEGHATYGSECERRRIVLRYPIWLATLVVAALALAGGLTAMSSAPARAQEEHTVNVGDFWFGNSSSQGAVYETTIEVGETVTWNFEAASAPHTATSNDGLWDSGTENGGTFEHTFNQAGTFEYHCNIHPNLMKGRIVVEAAAEQPTAGSPTAAISTPVPVSGAPNSGYGLGGSTDATMSGWWFMALLGVAGTSLLIAGAFVYRRSRL